MSEAVLFHDLLLVMLALSAVTFVALFAITAPYGRHARAGFGPMIPSTVGWVLMEAPASLGFAAFYLAGEHRAEAAPLALFALWQLHYVNRAFVYPFRRRGGDKPMPLLVAGMGVGFNVANAYLNARFVSHFARYPHGWLADPRFIGGVLVFVVGFAINQHADQVLRRLRAPGERGYKIPHGGLYRFVSAPNYFGELVEWIGFAVASWSPAALVFVVWTVANLLPRARANHQWYRRTFADYPTGRRALVPFLL
jgi:protein-S-isoprenylcysteine O-methyltransferase Ste14